MSTKFFANPKIRQAAIATTALGIGGIAFYSFRQFQIKISELESKHLIPQTSLSHSPQSLPINSSSQKDEQSSSNPETKVQTPKTNQITDLNEDESGKRTQKKWIEVKRITEIPELTIGQPLGEKQLLIIVADLPYNRNFEQKILRQINKLKRSYPEVRVFRADLNDQKIKKELQDRFEARIRDETIFLLRNKYESTLSHVNFDVYMQYPAVIDTYLKSIKTANFRELHKELRNLGPGQSLLVYLWDKTEPQLKQKERMLTVKYVEMQLSINGMQKTQIFAIEKDEAEALGISPESARANSLHLVRPHNQYTPYPPNLWLTGQDGPQGFHLLPDIALFAKGERQLLIPHYLSSIEIFDGALANPYVLNLRVDRNRVQQADFQRLLRILGEIKRTKEFADVGFNLRLGKVAGGSNQNWQIVLSNIDQLDRQAKMHGVSTESEVASLGYKQETFLRDSCEYLYEGAAEVEGLKDFIRKGLKGELEGYFRSQEKDVLGNVPKLVGSHVEDLLKDGKDHLVYEYSQFCPTCKEVSPLISKFATFVKEQPTLNLQKLQFHRLNCNLNRSKALAGSPYVPNIYYFKSGWSIPVKFPIQAFGVSGLVSLYNFCKITEELKTLDWQQLESAIKSAERGSKLL